MPSTQNIPTDSDYRRHRERIESQRDGAIALLHECYRVIWEGCASADARPERNDLIPLLRKIESQYPLPKEPNSEVLE